MKLYSSCLAVLTLTGLVSAQKSCNANDCLRQVRASNFPTRSTRQDCMAYQASTVVQTVYSTATTTTTVTPAAKRRRSPALGERDGNNGLVKRAGTIPAYASSCSAPGAYASACSCIGITASASTVSTVTSTTTVVATTTAASTPQFCFIIKLNYPAAAVGSTIDTTKIYAGVNSGDSLVAVSSPADATKYCLAADKSLVVSSPGADETGDIIIYFYNPGQYSVMSVADRAVLAYNPGYSFALMCTVAPVTLQLACTYGTTTASVFGVILNGQGAPPFIANSDSQAHICGVQEYYGCTTVTLTAVPV